MRTKSTAPENTRTLESEGCGTPSYLFDVTQKYFAAAVPSSFRAQGLCPTRQGRAVVRGEESAAVLAFHQKMASEAVQAQYRRRSRVVEFCHAWIKSKLGLRQFHVRGLVKVQMEMLWACLTYNLQHWIRLRKLANAPAA